MSRLDVVCAPDGAGWACEVRTDQDGRRTEHAVTIDPAGVAGLASPATIDDAERLVETTFEFLLERESSASILASFDLAVVSRYFPEYPREIRRRLER
ncbi:MAG TPA: hypothetical protein VD763_05060 [Candidatus Saccharimonadales bacterium]|nr:hypothetical protein [Candidatus Saccharimonadales bacterium]